MTGADDTATTPATMTLWAEQMACWLKSFQPSETSGANSDAPSPETGGATVAIHMLIDLRLGLGDAAIVPA